MSSIFDVLSRAFSSDGFVPRRVCGLWPDWLVWEHVAGNALIWIAYIALPIQLWRLGSRRSDWGPLKGLLTSFVAFIGLCGLGHFLDMLAFFRPMYRLSGHVLIVTGAASLWTAWSLRLAWPTIVAMKSPAELERVIAERTEELTRAVDELRRAEADRAYLATIVESSQDAIVSKDLDGVITYWNPGAERIFGYRAAEAVGRPITFLFPPDQHDEESELLDRLKRGELVDHHECARLTKDGRSIDVSLTISPIKDRSGRIVGFSKIARDVTEKRAAEDALRESEERMRSVVDHVVDGIITIDEHGTVESFNPAAEELFGYRAAEVRGRNVKLLMPEPYRSEHDGYLADYRRTGQGKIIGTGREILGRRQDGSTFPMELAISAMNLVGRRMFTGIVRDITERKRAEESLRRGEEQFRSLADSIAQLVWMARPDGHIFWYNRRWYDYTGTAPGEMEGWGWQSVHDPEMLEDVLERWKLSIAEGKPFEMVFPLRGADGRFRTFLTRGIPSRDAEGRILGWFGTNTDIDEQKRAEEALRESEGRLRDLNENLEGLIRERTAELSQQVRLIDQAHDAILIRARDGSISSWNQGAERLYGYARQEARGRSSHELLKTQFPRPLPEIEEELARLGSWEGELIHERRDGVRVVVASRWVADRDGLADEVVLEINSDITARKEAEAALRESRDLAMAATRAKGEFLANMSHEIRTPMNGVIGMTELLMGTRLDDLQRGYAETIRGSGEALLTVIDDILDFSKIEAGKLTLESEVFDVRLLMREVADLLAPRARQKGLDLNVRAGLAVPDWLVGDPVRIRQVLTNLAGNSVKFTDRGEVEMEASLAAEGENWARVRISVRDTGIGIPDDRQAVVFDSFTQVEGGNRRRHGGTGLGLAICRNLVALMGGEIGLESALGEGSRFWFELPLGKGTAPAASGVATGPERPAADRPGEEAPLGLRILLADDSEVNRRVAIGLALRLGCQVEAVENGREALEAIDHDRHDLLLMDVQMPEMDGLAATAAIRRREGMSGERIPIIAMTAHAMQGDRETCLAAGMDGYLSKPISQDSLRDALRRWAIEARTPARPPEGARSWRAKSSFAAALGEMCGDDRGMAREVVAAVLRDAPSRLGRIEEAMAARDGRRVALEAHTLKGVFLTVGAPDMAQDCQDLIKLADLADFTSIERIYQAILGRWRGLEGEAAEYLATLS